MGFSPELAEIRFGCGRSPVLDPPQSVAEMLAALRGADPAAARFPVPTYETLSARFEALAALRRTRRRAAGTPAAEEADRRIRALKRTALDDATGWAGEILLRWTHTTQGFRERLTAFWADHFTTVGKSVLFRAAISPFVEEAIRPNIAGRFEDLLIAAVTHPVMLHYFDQDASFGPASPAARRAGRPRGLNENLAREILELHTLGVEAPYGQEDVRQFAELLTGMTLGRDGRFRFRPGRAEPGAETVLGRRYGGKGRAGLEAIHAALRDLARHPATAAHIARKLAVHFVSDRPPAELVAALAARFVQSGGNLIEVYGAMLEHPQAWQAGPGNVKPPADFVASTMRALAVAPERIRRMPPARLRRLLLGPMARMGQPWQRPAGPDGWPEADAAWITPQGLAARLRWVMRAPVRLRPDLPDPRTLARQVLRPDPGAGVMIAAMAAETRAEAVGLVLASPDFQRR